MLTLTHLYWLVGAIMALVAMLTLLDASHPRRFRSGLFWLCYAAIFIVGDWMPNALVGALVIGMALLAGLGGLAAGPYQALSEEKQLQSLQRIGKKLFIPALAIPGVTLVLVLVMGQLPALDWFDPKNLTLLSLGVACLLAFGIACYLTRESPRQGGLEAKRLLEAIGWAFLLPHLLATLGLLFNQAGVGQIIAALSNDYLQLDSRLAAVTAYALAMAGFTVIMGNAFAAFPVITAGLGIPLLIMQHNANPAVMAAIGMFCGYCGTLLTPMAANFNIVPVALLGLKDQHAVIKAQAPTALLLLLVNIVLLDQLAF
ncbi:MAG: DUF979 domain-containing protein [Rheinheimera sp.]|nr:MAG: DUF979 domain-containing protein [Rheinheimera sp.]